MAESPVAQRRTERPLEPDAGNAAEGSEGPMPDCDVSQPIPVHGLCFYDEEESGNQETKNNFAPVLHGFLAS